MINLEKNKWEKCQPPSFKKICPCTILPKFFRFPPSRGGNPNLLSPPLLFKKEKGVQTMFNHYVWCSDELTYDKNTIFFYNSYIINDLKSK